MEIVYHPDYILHRHRGTHPERPERLEAVMERIEMEGFAEDIVMPEPADEKILTTIHPESYVKKIGSHPRGYLDGGDTYIDEKTYDIARRAVGGALLAADIANRGTAAMALLRPPGHHAGAGYGGGFCYFNNIALAAAHLKERKIAILDFDGHHGNGTSDIFYSDPNVLFISAHHHGIYPGTGESIAIGADKGEGFNVNIPFHTGVGDASYEYAWDEIIEPILKQNEPDIILVSLGTDGHYADGMTGLSLSSLSYIEMARNALKISEELCKGRVAFFLEGGYHLGSLAEIVSGTLSLCEGKDIDLEHTKIYDDKCLGRAAVDNTKKALEDHWDFY